MSLRTRGFSLLEIMVSMTLALVVFGLTVSFLVSGFRYSGRFSAQGEIQQQLAAAFSRMEMELRTGTVTGLSTASDGQGVILSTVALEDLTSSGAARWSDHAVVFVWDKATEKLWSKTWPPKPPVLAFVFDPVNLTPVPSSDLRAIADATNGTEKILAIGVQLFQVTSPPTSPLSITLRASRNYNGGSVRFELTRTVAMRNHT